jgi:hypothetical protein
MAIVASNATSAADPLTPRPPEPPFDLCCMNPSSIQAVFTAKTPGQKQKKGAKRL